MQPTIHADILTLDQEELLWQKGLLRQDNPVQLQCTVLYVLGINLALYAGKEHQNLKSIRSVNSQLRWGCVNGECVLHYKESLGNKTN